MILTKMIEKYISQFGVKKVPPDIRYVLDEFEQKNEELKNQLYFSTKHKLVLEAEYTSELNKYKQAFNEIEKCSSLDEDTVCTYKLKKIILDIINKAKEK